MIPLELSPEKEKQLRDLALARNEDLAQLVRRAVEEFLDLQAWAKDSADEWAESSVALTPEILPDEAWDEGADRGRGSGTRR